MSILEKNRYLLDPPFSESIETFLCPISKSKYEITNGLKIADGCRFFNELIVLQKKNNTYSETIMSPVALLNEAKKEGRKASSKVEELIDIITKKRPSFSRLDMSQSHLMGIINSTPDSFYDKSKSNDPSLTLKNSTKMVSDGALSLIHI